MRTLSRAWRSTSWDHTDPATRRLPSLLIVIGIAVLSSSCADTGGNAAPGQVAESSELTRSSPTPTPNTETTSLDGASELATTAATTTTTNFSLDAITASVYPVGQEWRERVPVENELDEMSAVAYNAWQRRISACMSDRGFTRAPRVYFDEKRTEFFRAVNPLNESVAQLFGYHAPDLPPPPVTADDDEESLEYLEALDGTDTDQSTGCGAVTKPAVYDLVEPVAADAQALLNDLDARIDGYWSSDLARSTLAEWTSCMNTQGFSAESPEELAVRFAGADEVSTEELQVRLTDLDCDREVGLTQQRSTWESDRVDEWASDTAAAWADLEPRIAQVIAEITALADE
mgnify:CR=1 FL=1